VVSIGNGPCAVRITRRCGPHSTTSYVYAKVRPRNRRSYRFEHVRVPLPVRRSGGTFTVTNGHDPEATTVTLTTTFEPLDASGNDQLTEMIHAAFQPSLDSLRRYVEDERPWDAD
jgi:Polyketide cyclase / dehydrase and lipid transport